MDEILQTQARFVAALAQIKVRMDYEEQLKKILKKRIKEKPPTKPPGIIFFTQDLQHAAQKERNTEELTQARHRLKVLTQFYQCLDTFSKEIYEALLSDYDNRVYYFLRYRNATYQLENMLNLRPTDTTFEWQNSALTYHYNNREINLRSLARIHFVKDFPWFPFVTGGVIGFITAFLCAIILSPLILSLVGPLLAYLINMITAFIIAAPIAFGLLELGASYYLEHMQQPISDDNNAYLPIKAISADVANEAARLWQNRPAMEQDVVNEADEEDDVNLVARINIYTSNET